jgi:hypothetical protein
MRRSALILSLLPVGLACASIVHGSRQSVAFTSAPSSARVTVDNQLVGNTPVVAKLTRKNKHIVRIELEGYSPFETTLARRTSGWVWGNIVVGGLIGLAVDATTGAMYKLTPEEINGTLGPVTSMTRDGLGVVVVLRADPAWEKIGSLVRTPVGRSLLRD